LIGSPEITLTAPLSLIYLTKTEYYKAGEGNILVREGTYLDREAVYITIGRGYILIGRDTYYNWEGIHLNREGYISQLGGDTS